jgi:hypothetical protein
MMRVLRCASKGRMKVNAVSRWVLYDDRWIQEVLVIPGRLLTVFVLGRVAFYVVDMDRADGD